MSESHPEHVKIFFEPPDDPEEDWHTAVESMWAKPIEEPQAPGGRVYILDNSPWYVFNVSYEDQICTELRHESFPEPRLLEVDVLYFTHVWKRSGNSTYNVFLQGGRTVDAVDFQKIWERLSDLGCSYEGMNSRLLSVTVKPKNDLDAIEFIFNEALESGVFAWQTQHRFDPNELLTSAIQ